MIGGILHFSYADEFVRRGLPGSGRPRLPRTAATIGTLILILVSSMAALVL